MEGKIGKSVLWNGIFGLLVSSVCFVQVQMVCAATPLAPTNLTAQVISSTQINLSWKDNSNNETGFHIEHAIGSGSFTQIASTNANVTTYSNTGLQPHTTYQYRVRAFAGSSNSPYSNTVTVTTGPLYYLDGSASSNGCGTQTSPWNTVASVNMCTFSAGDIIYIKRGTTLSGNPFYRGTFGSYSLYGVLSPSGHGIAGNQITIDAYGTGANPIIDAKGQNYTAAILLYNQDYWTIQNVEARNWDVNQIIGLRWGILVNENDGSIKHNINIVNNIVRNVYGSNIYNGNPGFYYVGGIFVQVVEPGHMDGLLIQGNQVYDVVGEGIWFGGENEHDGGSMNWGNLSTNVVVRNNSVTRTGADGIVVLGSDNELIENNFVDGAGQLGAPGTNGTINIGGLWSTRHRKGKIQYNEVCRTKMWQGDGFGLHTDFVQADTCIIQYNYSHDNDGPFFCDPWPEPINDGTPLPITIFRYNISQNDFRNPAAAGLVGLGLGGAQFYNNTIYSTGPITFYSTGHALYSQDGKNEIRNNIFFGFNSASSWDVAEDSFYTNGYYGNLAIPSNENKAITSSPNSVYINAGSGGNGLNSVNGYKLDPHSACLNAGVIIRNNGGRDFWGAGLYNGFPDLGAYEKPGIIPVLNFLLND
jgi:hypothetical protein